MVDLVVDILNHYLKQMVDLEEDNQIILFLLD